MKHRFIATVAISLFILCIAAIGTARVSAQQPAPTADEPVPTPAADLERRIYELEAEQRHAVEALESANEQSRSIATGFVTIITVMVAVQGAATGIQLYREGRRDDRQARREEERDRIDRVGVEQVARVMDVVQRTLENRLRIDEDTTERVSSILTVVQRTLEAHLRTEEQAREKVEQAQRELEESLQKYDPLMHFYERFQNTIRRSREAIDKRASRWAKEVSRHDFRGMTNDLNNFAQEFDKFTTEFEPLEEAEEGKPPPRFSARVPYVRGIAALYASRPEIAKRSLEEVVRLREPGLDESQRGCDRRVANAYYYLGVIESNFGNHREAIELFEEANKLDLQERDFLTRVVTAEAYVMMNRFDEAREYLDQVEGGLREIEDAEGRLQNHQVRLQSRAALIRANMAILARKADWRDEVQRLVEPVHVADPQYYYATATLAQVYHEPGNPGDAKAQELFSEAYMVIERSGHLLTVTEARSRILLLMVAGMCCKHGPMDEARSGEFLDRADALLGSLPRMGSQVCTVFSTLSKGNESSDITRYHIRLIREGTVLV
jgi:tetratricopeptide (TPR) repeat protein